MRSRRPSRRRRRNARATLHSLRGSSDRFEMERIGAQPELSTASRARHRRWRASARRALRRTPADARPVTRIGHARASSVASGDASSVEGGSSSASALRWPRHAAARNVSSSSRQRCQSGRKRRERVSTKVKMRAAPPARGKIVRREEAGFGHAIGTEDKSGGRRLGDDARARRSRASSIMQRFERIARRAPCRESAEQRRDIVRSHAHSAPWRRAPRTLRSDSRSTSRACGREAMPASCGAASIVEEQRAGNRERVHRASFAAAHVDDERRRFAIEQRTQHRDIDARHAQPAQQRHARHQRTAR